MAWSKKFSDFSRLSPNCLMGGGILAFLGVGASVGALVLGGVFEGASPIVMTSIASAMTGATIFGSCGVSVVVLGALVLRMCNAPLRDSIRTGQSFRESVCGKSMKMGAKVVAAFSLAGGVVGGVHEYNTGELLQRLAPTPKEETYPRPDPLSQIMKGFQVASSAEPLVVTVRQDGTWKVSQDPVLAALTNG